MSPIGKVCRVPSVAFTKRYILSVSGNIWACICNLIYVQIFLSSFYFIYRGLTPRLMRWERLAANITNASNKGLELGWWSFADEICLCTAYCIICLFIIYNEVWLCTNFYHNATNKGRMHDYVNIVINRQPKDNACKYALIQKAAEYLLQLFIRWSSRFFLRIWLRISSIYT